MKIAEWRQKIHLYYAFQLMATKTKKGVKGGARKGAGRKPVEDPKVMVPLYIETSVINALGGFEEVRAACYAFLKSQAEHSTKK